MLKYMQ